MITNESYLPAEYNTGIVRGDFFEESFSLTIDGVAVDLEGATAKIQIRVANNPAASPIAEYGIITDIGDVTGLRIRGTENNILTWTIDSSDTKNFTPGVYKYDIEIAHGSRVRTYVKGNFNVERDITV